MSDQGDIVEISYVPDDSEDDERKESQAEATAHEDIDDEDEHDEHDEDKPKKSIKKKKQSSALKKLQKQLDKQEEIIEKVVAERDDFKDKYLRTLAEMDNFRKRVKKEKEEFQKYVLADFLLGLLEVLDNLERALTAKSQSNSAVDEKSIISGVEMIYKQLTDLLKKNNVMEIDSLGKFFDPNIHQALSKEEKEGIAQPVVLEVYQKGYTYNSKLLRPTLAKVAIPKEPGPQAPETESIDQEA